jgi:hypothetical protein
MIPGDKASFIGLGKQELARWTPCTATSTIHISAATAFMDCRTGWW